MPARPSSRLSGCSFGRSSFAKSTPPFVWLAFLLAALMCAALAPRSFAQPFELDPSRWFPLEVGNYWHYTCCRGDGSPLFTDYIRHTERDTVVNEQRWVLITETTVRGPGSSSDATYWLSLTEDHYLLESRGLMLDPVVADTLWPSLPRSVFTVMSAEDTALPPFQVRVTVNDLGTVADSTHLSLEVSSSVDTDQFVYQIGPAVFGSFGSTALVGALVNGLELGDTSEIRGLVDTSRDPDRASAPSMRLGVEVYPNPASGTAFLRLVSDQSGPHEVSIYNVLGQRVYWEAFTAVAGQVEGRLWTAGPEVGSGVYVVQLTGGGGQSATKRLVLLKGQ